MAQCYADTFQNQARFGGGSVGQLETPPEFRHEMTLAPPRSVPRIAAIG